MALEHVAPHLLTPFAFHEEASHAMLRGQYLEAESLFRQAAAIAYTIEGRLVLLEKAEEAKQHAQQRRAT